MQNSGIEWTHHTFNPWRGCTKASQGCKHCYAETLSGRNPGTLGVWGPQGSRVVAAESYWRQPLRWNAQAEMRNERQRVFCASLADIFEADDTMPPAARAAVHTARQRLWNIIEQTPSLAWLLLTKRPENIRSMTPDAWYDWEAGGFPSNIWIGTSVEDQATADARIPLLIDVPARVRFLSCEPLLGSVDLSMHLGIAPNHDDLRGLIHWIIAGGESGANARPMHPDWARGLRDHCQAAGVAFFFKQWGQFGPPTAFSSGELAFDDGQRMRRHRHKSDAGRELDGRTHDDFPVVDPPEPHTTKRPGRA